MNKSKHTPIQLLVACLHGYIYAQYLNSKGPKTKMFDYKVKYAIYLKIMTSFEIEARSILYLTVKVLKIMFNVSSVKSKAINPLTLIQFLSNYEYSKIMITLH